MEELLCLTLLIVGFTLVGLIALSPTVLAMLVMRGLLDTRYAQARATRTRVAHLHLAVLSTGGALAVITALAPGWHLLLDVPLLAVLLSLERKPNGFPDLPAMRAMLRR